jgi:hypothetical protein
MCCTGTPLKPSQILAASKIQRAATKIIPMPLPKGVDAKHYDIPKEIKQALIMQQQLARIPQKTG